MSSYLYDIGSTDLFKKTNTSTTSDVELQEKELSNDISRLIELKIEVTKLEKSIESRKSYLKTQQENAQNNSQQNAEAQQQSIQTKMQADTSLEQQKALIREKEIILQGVFDLAKANIPVPMELQRLVSDMLQNVTVPIEVQNQQQQQALAQQEAQQQQQMQGGQPQEMQEEPQMEIQQQ